MKRVILGLGLFALMTAFALTSNQAFAADWQNARHPGLQFGQWKQQERSNVPLISDLMNKKVTNERGQDLGKIEDMLVTKDGRISYLIIGSGGDFGLGNYYPVPFKSVQWTPEQRAVMLPNVDKQKLQNGPKVSKDDFAQLEDSSFEQKVNSYYGQQNAQQGKQTQEQQGQQPGQQGKM